MPSVTVRGIPDEIHRALKVRAARNGRSTEAEIRDILENTVRPVARLKIGTALAEFGRKHGGLELELTRDAESATPADFE